MTSQAIHFVRRRSWILVVIMVLCAIAVPLAHANKWEGVRQVLLIFGAIAFPVGCAVALLNLKDTRSKRNIWAAILTVGGASSAVFGQVYNLRYTADDPTIGGVWLLFPLGVLLWIIGCFITE